MPSISSANGRNGNGHHGAVTTLAWEPESPFSAEQEVPGAIGTASRGPAPRSTSIETPFTGEFVGEDARPSAHAEAFASLMNDLHDEEFSEALEDLVNDASAVLEEGFSGEIGDPERERFAMERTIRTYFEPLRASADEMIDRIATELAERDVSAMSDGEVDELFEGFAPMEGELSPAFEGFLGGLLKKAKGAINAARKVATKVAGVIALPHMLILNRLKGLVNPLLERVLRFAIDKLPVALRPIATQLAQRFLGIKPGAGTRAAAAKTAADAIVGANVQAPLAAAADADAGGQSSDAGADQRV
ncbi:MAG TPA: hypothetical protein VJT85_05685, partial [Gemmatimonadaceae bacterium]|nr:hypothetical protein [Gemmatimonadaceae bacterium]